MKRVPCPCPALPRFWHPGPLFMAEGSGTQARGKGPPLSIQVLRAQYEGLRQQQRAQAHLVILPKGEMVPAPAPAQPVVSDVWINTERRSSLSLKDPEPEAQEMPEEADRGHLQTPKSTWHTHLEMHRSVQNYFQETSHPAQQNGRLTGSEQKLPQEGDLGFLENSQRIQQGTETPAAAQHRCHLGNDQAEATGSNLNTSVHCPLPIKNLHRAGKSAHYPFPQRKTPRISQAARNLGLYGPA